MKRIAILLLILFTPVEVFSQSDNADVNNGESHVIAIVLGKKITVEDKDELEGLIFRALLEQFAKENNIEPIKEEVDAFVHKPDEQMEQEHLQMERDRRKLIQELKESSLSEQERKRKNLACDRSRSS